VEREVLLDFGFTPEQADKATIMKGNGCKTCNGSGYKGRVALYEVMRFSRLAEGDGAAGRLHGRAQGGRR
jgi:type II secretory ATPase GspE/PulE/Tfp pilus assembly ATPase PilB-like protein